MASLKYKQCRYDISCEQAGTVTCEGCTQVFCTKHFTAHRSSLDDELNILLNRYNELKSVMTEESIPLSVTKLHEKINEWEEQSMKKIQQKAAQLRDDLMRINIQYSKNILTELRSIADNISKRKEQDNFMETDLARWRQQLNDLQIDISSSLMMHTDRHDMTPLISNVSIEYSIKERSELFDRTLSDHVRIEDDGKVVSGVQFLMGYTEIRGRNDYTSGCHLISLQIEHLDNNWSFLGINSKSVPLKYKSFTCESAYGWCNDNYIYMNGSCHWNKIDPRIEMKKDDIITLIFDCDNYKISMTNERTKGKYNLSVDIDNCPFPWQLHVIFRSMKSRIRIIS